MHANMEGIAQHLASSAHFNSPPLPLFLFHTTVPHAKRSTKQPRVLWLQRVDGCSFARMQLAPTTASRAPGALLARSSEQLSQEARSTMKT